MSPKNKNIDSLPELKSMWKEKAWGLSQKELLKHPEIENIMEEFRRIVQKYPEILIKFPEVFASILYKKSTKEDTVLTYGVFPENASFQDLQNFLHFWKMIEDRDYLKIVAK